MTHYLYARLTKQNTLDHHVLRNKPGKQIAQKTIHIQNVNALHSHYKDFMSPFIGPASKYLERYLRWFLLRS
jgi:hypothetical protein